MSYTTYHNIRQLPNGDFLVKTKCSNDDCPPATWTMDYYRRTFPFLSNEGLRAVFLLQGQYWGNRYHPAKWKRLDKLTAAYGERQFEITGDRMSVFDPLPKERYEREPHDLSYEAARDQWQADVTKIANDLAAYLRAQTEADKVGRYVIQLHVDVVSVDEGCGRYVCECFSLRSRRIHTVLGRANAYVFNRTKSEIDALVARLPDCWHAEAVEEKEA